MKVISVIIVRRLWHDLLLLWRVGRIRLLRGVLRILGIISTATVLLLLLLGIGIP